MSKFNYYVFETVTDPDWIIASDDKLELIEDAKIRCKGKGWVIKDQDNNIVERETNYFLFETPVSTTPLGEAPYVKTLMRQANVRISHSHWVIKDAEGNVVESGRI